MLNAFGAAAVTFMVVMYALEGRHRGFIAAFSVGCVLSSTYGFLAGAWPFGVVELIWAGIAFARFLRSHPGHSAVGAVSLPRATATSATADH